MQDNWINKKMMSLKIICGAVFMSLPIYGGLGFYLVRTGKIIPEMIEDVQFKLVLVVVAIGTGLFTFYMKALLLSKERIIKGKDIFPSPHDSSEKKYSSLFQRFFQAHIIIAALSESVGIYGLLIILTTGDERLFLFLLMLSAILMIIHFPRDDRFQDLIRYFEIQRNMGTGI